MKSRKYKGVDELLVIALIPENNTFIGMTGSMDICQVPLNIIKNESLNEALHDDWSIEHEYGVFRTGGSIGEKPGVVANLGGEVGILVSTFNDEKDAKEYAKRMKGYLSPGERKYYGMSYKVKKLDDKIKDQMAKLMA